MMKKSLLTASVLGAIGTIASASALADVNGSTYCKPGFYAGLQGGRSDTFYGTDDVLSQAAANGNGSFSNPPTTTIDNQRNEITTASSGTTTSVLSNREIDDTGIGGRVYAGYQFNPYLAVELGFTQFAKTSFSALGTSTTNSNTQVNNPEYDITTTTSQTTTSKTRYDGDVTEHAIDLVAKGTLPLRYGFGVYAKAGMAYITANRYVNSQTLGSTTSGTTTVDDGGNITTTSFGPYTDNRSTFSTIYDKTYQAFVPVGGAGVNWTIPNSNFSVDASYTRFFASGGIKNASLAALGLEYKFA